MQYILKMVMSLANATTAKLLILFGAPREETTEWIKAVEFAQGFETPNVKLKKKISIIRWFLFLATGYLIYAIVREVKRH